MLQIILLSWPEFLDQDFLKTLIAAAIPTILSAIGAVWILMRQDKKEKEALQQKEQKEKEERQQERLDAFQIYGSPLVRSSVHLVHRLHDLLESRPRFLRKDAPQIEYHLYNYISTLYRFCSVLGWIRAIRREVTSLDISKKVINKRIEEALTNFQTSLLPTIIVKETR